MHRLTQHTGKLYIRHRVGSRSIQGPGGTFIGGDKVNGTDDVIEAHPAHPLTAVAKPATQRSLEDWQELLQGPTVRRQHHPEPQVDDADAEAPGSVWSRLPRFADFRQEPVARCRVFRKNFIPSIAVDPGGAGAHQGAGRVLKLGKNVYQRFR